MSLSNVPQQLCGCNFVCSCGATHSCSLETVLCKENALAEIPTLLQAADELVLVTDGNTAPLAGDALALQLEQAGHTVHRAHFNTVEVVVPNEQAVAHLQEQLTAHTGALVGVGSGVINDLCKYVAHQAGLPYLIAATAPSMDGYASKGAALILNGMKVTVPAAPPKWIVGDPALLATAPLMMLRSGIGDLIGKYSCLNDWKLSAMINDEAFCPEIFELTMRQAESCCREIEAVLARRPEAVGRLFEGLVMVGIAMSLAGNSRPASGSEHHLAHFYEIVGLQRQIDYLPHGIDVAFGTLVTCRLREKLCQQANTFEKLETAGLMAELTGRNSVPFDARAWRLKLGVVYGPMAREVAELQQKTAFYAAENRERRARRILAQGPQIRALLAEAPTGAEIAALLERAGIDTGLYYQTYGTRMIGESIVWAKDLKDRYTLLNLLEDLGVLEEAAGEYIKDYFK